MDLKDDLRKDDIEKSIEAFRTKAAAKAASIISGFNRKKGSKDSTDEVSDDVQKVPRFNTAWINKAKGSCQTALSKTKSTCAEGTEKAVSAVKSQVKKVNKKYAIAGFAAIFAAVAVFGGYSVIVGPDAYALTINGETTVYIENADLLDVAIEAATTSLAEETGVDDIVFVEEAIVLEKADEKAKQVECLNAEELQEVLLEAEVCQVNGWGIQVDGEVVVTLAAEEDANEVLDNVVDNYRSEGAETIHVSYKEDVKVVQSPANPDEIISVADAVDKILIGAVGPTIYEVQEGDTVWDIAIANDMNTESIANANPDIDPEKLQVGQEITLYELKPFLTVLLTEQTVGEEIVYYGIEYEFTDTLVKGETRVKSEGTQGLREVTKEIVKENGIVVGSKELDSNVLTEAVPQVVLSGTKIQVRPTYSAAASGSSGGSGDFYVSSNSGSLGSPMKSLQVSSAYGSRGGGRHQGVDLRNPRGTAIYAAESGTVTFAGYKGTYGNLVIVNHGNGMETYYAHCDTINVSSGTSVVKGQQIATVGMTGRATGYHLHFEVKINGTNYNPMSFL